MKPPGRFRARGTVLASPWPTGSPVRGFGLLPYHVPEGPGGDDVVRGSPHTQPSDRHHDPRHRQENDAGQPRTEKDAIEHDASEVVAPQGLRSGIQNRENYRTILVKSQYFVRFFAYYVNCRVDI